MMEKIPEPDVKRKPHPLDNRYFRTFQREVNIYVQDKDINPRRQIKIVGLADAMSEGKLTYQEARERGHLSEDEESLLVTFVQIKSELNRAVEEGILSAEEAEKWRKKFCFSASREPCFSLMLEIKD